MGHKQEGWAVESDHQFLDSLVVRISACHVEGPGSIPGRGENFFGGEDFLLRRQSLHLVKAAAGKPSHLAATFSPPVAFDIFWQEVLFLQESLHGGSPARARVAQSVER